MSPRIYGTFIFRLKNQTEMDTLYNHVKQLAGDNEHVPIPLRSFITRIQGNELKLKLKTKTTPSGIVCTLPTSEKIKLPKKKFPIKVLSGKVYPTPSGYKLAVVYVIRTKLRELNPEKTVGLDLGVYKIVTSEPAVYKFPKSALKAIKQRNRKALHRHLVAFYSQVIATLCKTYDIIAVERFDSKLQPIAGIDVFYRTLQRQTQKYGKKTVFVNPKNTSTTCATCDQKLTYTQTKTPYCPNCKTFVDRDVNAATNIKKRSFKAF